VHKGEIWEEGQHTELLARGGLYARLYELQYHSQDRFARIGAPEEISSAASGEQTD
jgi:ATP-binding cassette subfamily B protein